jgi:hypothetical protein
VIARQKALPKKRATPRTHRCVGCNSRISSSVCPTCKTRKATKRGNIGKRCDALWAAIVKLPGKCFLCGKTEGLEAAHIIGRAQRVVRWSIDPMNGIPLCHMHHRLFDSHRIQRDRLIEAAIGVCSYDALIKKAQGVWDKQYPLAGLKARLAEVT